MNAGFAYRDRIDPEVEGETVLAFLSRRYRHSTETVWRARLLAGEVKLGEAVARPDDRLRRGTLLVWNRPPWQEPPAPLAFAVLFRDEDLLAVAKPRGLPSVPGGGFLTHTLLHVVQRTFPTAAPLHRLGRGTSGIVLFALTTAARRRVSAAWREGRVAKVYRALVCGWPSQEAFDIDAAIGPAVHPRLGHVHAAMPAGKPALSHVRVLGRLSPAHPPHEGASAGCGDAERRAALVEVRIPTGRPHQIRIHLAAAGHPLVGDPLYGVGGRPLPSPALPGDGGYLLHAHRLALKHPTTGRPLEIECALPATLRG
jgi:23S rRNA pseudouridine1911/1915/1917 synthase